MTSIFLAISAGNSPENAMFTNFGFKHIVSAMALINSGSNPVATSSFINDVGGAASEMPTVSVPCSIKLGGCGKQSDAARDSCEPEASMMAIKVVALRRDSMAFTLYVQKETVLQLLADSPKGVLDPIFCERNADSRPIRYVNLTVLDPVFRRVLQNLHISVGVLEVRIHFEVQDIGQTCGKLEGHGRRQ